MEHNKKKWSIVFVALQTIVLWHTKNVFLFNEKTSLRCALLCSLNIIHYSKEPFCSAFSPCSIVYCLKILLAARDTIPPQYNALAVAHVCIQHRAHPAILKRPFYWLNYIEMGPEIIKSKQHLVLVTLGFGFLVWYCLLYHIKYNFTINWKHF